MSEAVSVRHEWLEIPTYPLGADCPYPTFDRISRRGLYPYAMKRDFSVTPAPARHRAVVLENRYVRATVLPEMGGRVYSLYDKIAGEETFMVTPSIKYQAVAVRGAWIAGGIEFNFGHRGHSVSTVSPVSWAVRTDADGSAAVWVGSVVRPTGARWAVRIGLSPDRAALDLDVHTMGPQVLPGMMYWWTNAAVEVTDQSRFFYFGRYANSLHAMHGWPITDGKDYSWFRNRIVGSDMFLMETDRDYIGFYDYSRHHGLAQTADRIRAPGQKYFTWGADQRGRFWDLVFSDSEQTYCEIQRGRHVTQHVTEPIAPMSHESWRETWIPIAGTEGFSATESDLVLSVVDEDDGAATIRLAATTPQRQLHLTALAGDEPVAEFDVEAVEPGRMFTAKVDAGAGRKLDGVRVVGADGSGRLDWQRYVFDESDWVRPNVDDFNEDTASTEELFLRAERTRFATLPKCPEEYCRLYRKVLARDGGHSGAHRALAEQAMYEGRCESAIEHLREALARSDCDGVARTRLGWALLACERTDEAAEQFAQAARNEADRRGALAGLTFAHIRAGRWDEACAAADRLLAERPRDLWGRWLKVVVLRHAGRNAQAAELLESLLGDDPLWPLPHAEAMLLDVPVDLADGQCRIGDDAVAAAEPYLDLGLWQDAQAVLRREEITEPSSPAVRLALLAYAHHRAGERDAVMKTLAQLRRSPAELAHPYSPTALAAVGELAQAHDEPMAHLMRGNALAARGRFDEAADAWQRAATGGLHRPVVYRNLAVASAEGGDTDATLAHYRRAWELAEGEIFLFVEFDRFLAGQDRQAERDEIYQQLSDETRARPLAATRRLLQHLDACRYDDALEILLTHTFARMEGDRSLRTCYLEAVVGKAAGLIDAGRYDQARPALEMGLDYPRNMHIGRSSKYPEEAPAHYMLGMLAEMTGDEPAARKHWQAAADEHQSTGSPAQAYHMLACLALGQEARATDLIHLIERLGRGEKDTSTWYKFIHGAGTTRLVGGLAQLARGRIDEARDIWRELLAESPDLRWVRLHLALPRALLERMARKVTGQAN